MATKGNRNYLKGRRFEYEVRNWYLQQGWKHVVRTAGSHGFADILAFSPEHSPEAIQCKVTESEAAGKRLLKKFDEETEMAMFYEQVMLVKVKGQKEWLRGRV